MAEQTNLDNFANRFREFQFYFTLERGNSNDS